MSMRIVATLAVIVIGAATLVAQNPKPQDPKEPAKSEAWPPQIARKLPPPTNPIDEKTRNELETKLGELTKKVGASADPDVAIYPKAVDYALRHDEFFDPKGGDQKKALTILAAGEDRFNAVSKGDKPWTTKPGNLVRGYRSRLDDSVQPYGLVINEKVDLTKPVPLYVWLHGRGDTRCDLQFIASFLGDKPAGPLLPENAIVLHPFGRYCNGWKSAGEIDVLEAIDDVKQKYLIDDDRILLGGFSMGGAGAWHMGAHYTDHWCAVHAGAGFVDVKRYQNITPDKTPPWYEVKLWGLYDVPDYRRNLLNVPVLAYSGEEDKQKASADIMEAELAAEGYQIPHLIGPKMGHKYHPDVLVDIHQRLAAIVEKGRDPYPTKVSLQTKTLRYNKMFWVEALALGNHWEDARIDADQSEPKTIRVTTKNVEAFLVAAKDGLSNAFTKQTNVDIDGQKMVLDFEGAQSALAFERRDGKWVNDDGSLLPWYLRSTFPVNTHAYPFRKVPGLQGPIDDAFVSPFAVVAPSQTSASLVDRWVAFESQHFTDRWRMLMRGDAPTTTDADAQSAEFNRNLVLWGTPKSNPLIAKIVDKLPIRWTDKTIGMGDLEFDATKVVPMLIYPNPLDPEHYVVINSGLTFREGHDRTNSLQNPKLGDWAFVDVTEPPSDEAPGKVLAAGFFDEEWRYVPAAK